MQAVTTSGNPIKNWKYPISLGEFLNLDIPPVDYVLKPVLPSQGKFLLSASQGSCKTFFMLNVACAIASGLNLFMNVMEVRKKRVCIILGEGGEAEMKRRLEAMAKRPGIDLGNLYVAYLPDLHLCDGKKRDEAGICTLMKNIEDSKCEVLLLDPIGQFFSGNGDIKQEVQMLTDIFDDLMSKYNIVIGFSHHWRKSTKDLSGGGVMAAGSYWWSAWPDGHITLKGKSTKLLISIEKVRSNEGGKDWSDEHIVILNNDNLWLEWVSSKGDKKELDKKLLEIFYSFNSQNVKMSDIVEKAKSFGSENTIKKYLAGHPLLRVDKANPKSHFVSVKVDSDVGQVQQA